MVQWGFYFDQARCVSCKACVLACKAWNSHKRPDVKNGSGHMQENWRKVTVTEYGDIPPNVDVLNLSISCNHCSDPACIKACPVQCIYREPNFGAVLVNHENCISCRKCVKVCPWGRPEFNDNECKKGVTGRSCMTKCTLCVDRISEGLKPACVAACIMRALDAGPVDELKGKYINWTEKVENFPDDVSPSLGISTKPNIIFRKKVRKNV